MHLDRLAAMQQRLCADVELIFAEAQPLRGHGRHARGHFLAAQQRTDSRDQFVGQEGFRKVVVGTGFEAHHAVDRIALRGQHEDGQRLSFGTQPPAYRQPVFRFHHQVQHEQVIRLALQVAVELLAVGDDAHVEPVTGQEPLQHVAQFGFVVQHDNPVDLVHDASPARIGIQRAIALCFIRFSICDSVT
ncbi:hypothetical protein R54767_04816 [Paraburkholderia gardini]|uniref:Uncharacterized protein n=1 Tax=Paraburkholderia gardini TaxID=2823469 RepID=A0ABM8UA20_9BURK|nr:hypothetical protein R54767_04816 [Paraburkholderia gardini]